MNTTIDLIRHGEPVGGRMYRGCIDHPLSDRGWAQMRAATAEPAAWDLVMSSPLLRCCEFAAELAARLALPLHIDARLREVGFGQWEGRTGDQIRAADPTALTRFYHDPVGARPGDAEPLEALQARVSAALLDMLTQHAGRHVLIVTHAGVIRAAIAHVLAAPLAAIYRTHVDNAAVTRLRQTAERPLTLVYHGRLQP